MFAKLTIGVIGLACLCVGMILAAGVGAFAERFKGSTESDLTEADRRSVIANLFAAPIFFLAGWVLTILACTINGD